MITGVDRAVFIKYNTGRLHAMTGAFVIHNNFGALSAAVMIGHYMEDFSTI